MSGLSLHAYIKGEGGDYRLDQAGAPPDQARLFAHSVMHQFVRNKKINQRNRSRVQEGNLQVWEVDYQRPEVRVRQDVAVVCDGEDVAVDSQLETQSETHKRGSFGA